MLEIRGMVVQYGGRPPFRAVDDVNLSVPAGTTVGLVGESGSGKSTLARSVVCLTRVTGGQVLLAGQDVTNARGATLSTLRRQVQMVFQDPFASLNPRMEIGAVVREAVSVRMGEASSSAACRAAGAELLDLVGVPRSAAERYPHQLSGGQLQRVAIARALALQPEVLLLDEITASLDVSVQARILNLLRGLQRELDLSILYISHDLSVVRYLTDSLYVMRHGVIVESGSSDEMFAAPQHPYTKSLLSAVPRLGGNRWRRPPTPPRDHGSAAGPMDTIACSAPPGGGHGG